jgi:signal transduction histidine kinase
MKGNMIIQEKDAQLFNKSITLLDNAIAEMRRVAHNMMPEALIIFGLKEAIQDYCDGINESHTVTMKFTAIGQGGPMEKGTEVILYRIVQELSNNALEHAAAKNIFIQFSQHPKGLSLVVEDDGVGFDSGQMTKGAGLQNVQSRVDYLKGHFFVESDAGKGTSVNVDIPL